MHALECGKDERPSGRTLRTCLRHVVVGYPPAELLPITVAIWTGAADYSIEWRMRKYYFQPCFNALDAAHWRALPSPMRCVQVPGLRQVRGRRRAVRRRLSLAGMIRLDRRDRASKRTQ